MAVMTITEALAEIKLINSKIEKRKEFILGNLTRYKHVVDPNAAKGGSAALLGADVQSISDLEDRLATIRTAIMSANLTHYAEVNGEKKSIYEWLVWKREVAGKRAYFYEQIYSQTKRKLDAINQQPQVYKNDAGQTAVVEMEANLPYMEFATKHADVTETLNKLDGVLSLKNATITIEV